MPGATRWEPPVDDHVIDLGLFAATVGAAAALDWSATDLVWSLWISSLLVGYGFIVVSLLLGESRVEEDQPVLRVLKETAGCLGALLTLGFVTVHFGVFHFLHSAFLNDLFPMVPESAGPWAGPDPVWWGELIGTCVERYWPFLAVTVLSRRGEFIRSFRTRFEGKEVLWRPYLNVIRMHLLIFAYGGLVRIGATGWFLYLVLVFYFFPLGALKELFERHLASAEA